MWGSTRVEQKYTVSRGGCRGPGASGLRSANSGAMNAGIVPALSRGPLLLSHDPGTAGILPVDTLPRACQRAGFECLLPEVSNLSPVNLPNHPRPHLTRYQFNIILRLTTPSSTTHHHALYSILNHSTASGLRLLPGLCCAPIATLQNLRAWSVKNCRFESGLWEQGVHSI